MKILMVCLGNICRSPLAEGIMKQLVAKRGLAWEIDSAGTGDWHIGDPPDHRSIKEAMKQGIDISGLRGRQITANDFEVFDRIYVMDHHNYREVLQIARNGADKAKVHFLLPEQQEVPDPWPDDALFAPVYQMIYLACEMIADHQQ